MCNKSYNKSIHCGQFPDTTYHLGQDSLVHTCVYGRTQYFKTEMELGPLSNWHTDSNTDPN